ncbi:cinnamoyl-CoA reductase 1-like [Rutidosis leptorrhynchoides]|uniref:cinnamoyl-CoA reductase 1-like n=1 Tax=Rutidosis leptorrhynchoides TaxID=125765 RepID=UPI003A98E8DB
MATSSSSTKEAVLVTGANGFIGSWVVKTLLENGYTDIHCSIHPSTDPSHLFSFLDPFPEAKLSIFRADLLDAAAISKAVEGCAGVFHVASPCTLEDPKDPELDLIQPAVQGTLNMLRAAKEFNVRRVVVTSSISSLIPNPKWDENKVIDETSWTDTDFCKSVQKWYSLSKTLAEIDAWKFAKENGLDMVTIHPSTVLGTMLQPGLNASSAVLLQLLQGSNNPQEHQWLGVIDVRDLAKAQLLLFESPAASGRYLATNGIYQFSEFALKVSQLFPDYPVYRFTELTNRGIVSCKDAAKKLIGLGLVFTPLEETILESAQSLKAKGLLSQ